MRIPDRNADVPEVKLHFLDYWRIIRLRKAVILTVFLLVILATSVITFLSPKIYTSRVRISVERDIQDVSGIGNKPIILSSDPLWIQTEFEKIRSSSILYEVIRKLELDKKWSKGLERPLTEQETAIELKGNIKVVQARGTSLIEIWVYDKDRQEAAQIANEIAAIYKRSRIIQRTGMQKGGIEILRKAFAEKNDSIRKAQTALDQMRRTNNIPDLTDGTVQNTSTLNTETLRLMELARIEASKSYEETHSVLTKLEGKSMEELRNSLPTVYPDMTLNSLTERFSLAEEQLTKLKQDFGPEHQDVVRQTRVLEKIDEQLRDKISGMMEGLRIRDQSNKANLESRVEEVNRARTNDILQSAKYRPYFDAKRELENLMRVRETINLRIEQEEVDVSMPTTSIVEIHDQAEPALRPDKPNIPLNIGLGVVVGLVLGIGLAFFIEYLDTSVKTIDDVERALQAAVLAVIPQNVGVLLEEGPETPHAEAYRVLRTNILFARKDENLNTITVVSGGAGEGKSTTLFNLATIFAQNGSRVLVIDSDLRRPSIHKLLKVSNSIGLTNYLLRQNTLEEVIQTTPLATLDFMPSGKLPSSSMGILSSVQMKELVKEMKRRYDFVFFDSPPIMGVSDASILASEVEMVVQVIQYRRYPQQVTLRAKQMIQKVGGNLLGLVLNNINMSQDENYYYYSGYYTDYYSKQDSDDAKVEKARKKAKPAPAKVEVKAKY